MQVQSSSRDSSDLSGGSFSEYDFTGSVDSGVDVREFSRARSVRNSGHGSLLGSGKFSCECVWHMQCVYNIIIIVCVLYLTLISKHHCDLEIIFFLYYRSKSSSW